MASIVDAYQFYQKSNVAVVTSVAGATAATTLAAANAARKGLAIYNDSAAALYVKLGTAAATNDFTVRLEASAYFELPFGYAGIVTGIWAAATGAARVTEMS